MASFSSSTRSYLLMIADAEQTEHLYQQQEAMFEVLVGLDAAVLWPLVVQRPRGVKEGNVTVPAGAEVNLLQLQSVRSVQVLLRVPQHPPVQSLA